MSGVTNESAKCPSDTLMLQKLESIQHPSTTTQTGCTNSSQNLLRQWEKITMALVTHFFACDFVLIFIWNNQNRLQTQGSQLNHKKILRQNLSIQIKRTILKCLKSLRKWKSKDRPLPLIQIPSLFRKWANKKLELILMEECKVQIKILSMYWTWWITISKVIDQS